MFPAYKIYVTFASWDPSLNYQGLGQIKEIAMKIAVPCSFALCLKIYTSLSKFHGTVVHFILYFDSRRALNDTEAVCQR